MHQLFTSAIPSIGQDLWLEGEERHYLGRALRARPGERFRLAAPDGTAAVAELIGFSGDQAQLRVERLDPDPNEGFDLHLALCAPRGEALDEAVDMAVQLGVLSLRLLRSERTLASIGQGSLKPERLQKRVKEAARQCLRARVPVWLEPLSLADALALPFEGERLFLSERGGEPLASALRADRAYLLLVGPEGGFSVAELQQAAAAGWRAISLGPRPLRVPTAVAAGMAGLRALQAPFERTAS